jgi:hypothetical protein
LAGSKGNFFTVIWVYFAHYYPEMRKMSLLANKKWYPWIGLGLLAVGIKLFSLNAQRVEQYYSNGVYPYISRAMRWLLGWLPFSLGDVAYGLAVCWLIYQTVKLVRLAFKRQLGRERLWRGVKKLGKIALVVYVVFNLLWGLNYNRLGMAQQLQLTMGRYTADDLRQINTVLLGKVNLHRQALERRYGAGGPSYPNNRQLFAGVNEAYRAAAARWPFMAYRPASLKPSLWGWLGNYTGFTGYYNPFSGEGQVNATVPRFLLPFTSCHEVGHQIGYAKENEANFAGYLSAAASPDTLFKYSVYLDLFLYANRNLYAVDTAAANVCRRQLAPPVLADLEVWRQFNRRHRNPVEPVVRWFYGLYLRSNEQPQGLMSYDAVTAFIIAYYKKFGEV